MKSGELALKIAESMGAEHAEVRYQRLERTAINLKKKSLEGVLEGVDEGIGVRVIVDGCRGFSYTNDLSEGEVEEAVRRAIKVAKIQGGKGAVRLIETELAKGEHRFEYKIDPRDVELDEKVSTLFQGIENASEIAGDKLRDVGVNYWDLWYKTHFLSSDGGDATQIGARFYFAFQVYGKTPTGLFSDSERFGMRTGIENLEKSIFEVSDRMAKRVLNQSRAGKPPIGPVTAILHSRSAGDFFHEVGHSFEGDIAIRRGSTFEGLKGKRVAGENLTIFEDPTIQGAWGSFFFDDEGVKPTKAILVEKGVLKGYIHSRETALKFGEKPNGHARAESYNFEPIVRMGNTCVSPGNWSDEELIAETKDGIYVAGAKGGSTSGGIFGFTASEAFQVINGELVKPLRSVNVSTSILEGLSNIDAVCREANYYITLCGKGGQSMAATGLVPTFRIDKAIVGG